jgi:hypothetical protein
VGKQVFFHTLTAVLESPDLIWPGSVIFEGIFPYTAAIVGLDRLPARRYGGHQGGEAALDRGLYAKGTRPKGTRMTQLTPFIAARSQLLTAIELFVADRDPVSVQALAGNARELLEDLCRQARVQPMTEFLLQDHPGKPKRDIYTALNLYRNCFKHMGDTEQERQEDQATLNQFDDTKNDYLLYVCVEDYLRLRKTSPFPMQVFQAWFCASHVELLAVPQHAQKFLDLFPGLQKMTRAEQKAGLAGCIERFSHDPSPLDHPATEPLVIDR